MPSVLSPRWGGGSGIGSGSSGSSGNSGSSGSGIWCNGINGGSGGNGGNGGSGVSGGSGGSGGNGGNGGIGGNGGNGGNGGSVAGSPLVERAGHGRGMGLPVARHVATRLGGAVGLERAPDGATVFFLCIPVSVGAPSFPASDASGSSTGASPVESGACRWLHRGWGALREWWRGRSVCVSVRGCGGSKCITRASL
jgi:hypothetical protein